MTEFDAVPVDDGGETGFEHPCPVCNGTGIDDFAPCDHCDDGYLEWFE